MNNIPKKGAWILIIKTVPVKDIFAPLYSIWYALPTGEFSIGDEDRPHPEIEYENIFPFRSMRELRHYVKAYKKDKNLVSGEERKTVEHVLDKYSINQQVKILTPFGTVKLQHNEYKVIDFNKYLSSIENGSFQVKFLNTSKGFKTKVRDQIFYIQSRGISLSIALGMVSGLVRSQNTYYMLAHPEYQRMFLSYFEQYYAKELVYKYKQIKKNPENEQYFFNEEEALKLNRKHYELS